MNHFRRSEGRLASKNFVSNEDVSVRLFQNDLLELFTRMHWSLPLIIFVPAVFCFLYRAVTISRLAGVEVFGLCLLGMLVWMFTEYVMHRFVFHTVGLRVRYEIADKKPERGDSVTNSGLICQPTLLFK